MLLLPLVFVSLSRFQHDANCKFHGCSNVNIIIIVVGVDIVDVPPGVRVDFGGYFNEMEYAR